MIISCDGCGKLIKKSPSLVNQTNFCNHKCYSKAKSKLFSGNRNPNWNGGNYKFDCIGCGKPTEKKKFGKRISKFCSKECAFQNRVYASGDKHWNWKGGTDTRYLAKIAPRPKPDNCEVCNEHKSKFKYGIVLDHNHKTGKFRGWLCGNCNTIIGLAKEDSTRLSQLIKYLKANENLL